MNQFLRKLAEKLSNFKLLSRIMMGVGALVAVVSVLGFWAFQISGGRDEVTKYHICAFGSNVGDHQLLGMFFFLCLMISLILGIIAAYRSFAFAFPKEKLSPIKSLPWIVAVAGGFLVINGVFSILVPLVDVKTEISAFWYVLAVVDFIVGAGCLCFIFPALRSHFFMPKLNNGQEEQKIEEKK